MAWTSEQQEAINAQGNLIVSAAAGTGKTAVLTERIALAIKSGVRVENLLVLTFTRAAAAEMKSRIAARLNQLAEAEKEEGARAFLRGEARAIDGAYISTVHAFCARVLRRHYHLLGLPPQSRVPDESERASLIETVKDELLSEWSGAEDASYRLLLSSLGGEDAAWDALMSAYRFSRSLDAPEEWLNGAARRYADEPHMEEIFAEAVTLAKKELLGVVTALNDLRDSLPPSWAKTIYALDDDLSRYRAMLLTDDYDAYREAIHTMAYERMLFPRDVAEEEKAPIKSLRELGKKLIKEQQSRFSLPREEECRVLSASGGVAGALVSLTLRFSNAFAQRKRDLSLLDYDDLEHFALAALDDCTVADEYRARFSLIAVDEYQDTNRVQEAIVERIRRVDNVFFVGDVKQSIYRFRHAEPSLFLEKLALFQGGAGKRVDLTRNFRSSKEVLDFANRVFEKLMTTESAGLAYDEKARLQAGETPPQGKAELHLIEKRAGETENDALEEAMDAEVEARLIAESIHALMQNGVYVDGKTGESRPYAYSDFALLLRNGTYAETYAQTLSQCGVPNYASMSGGYFDALEVQVLLNLLRVIDNRQKDIPLLSVLCSSVGDFSLEELSVIRASVRGGAFHTAFFAYANEPGELGEKVGTFTARFDFWRAESRLVSVETLLGRLLDETGFYEEMGASVNGARRQANLDALLERAHTFEKNGARGVWNFVRRIELVGGTVSEAEAQASETDVVRILTIHKSKGLEFPVVIVAGLGQGFNRREAASALQLHADYGLALRTLVRGEERGGPVYKQDNVLRQTVARAIRREQLAEEMRVLYVAMTRARNRLLLVGCAAKAEEKLAFRAPCTPLAVSSASSMAEWLLLAVSQADVTVHMRETFMARAKQTERTPIPAADPDVARALETRLSWRYPYASATLLPAKAAAGKGGERDDALPTLETPAFIANGKRDGAFFGTAAHAALLCLPANRRMDANGARAFLTALAQTGRLTIEQAEAVDESAIAWFTETELYARMSASARCEREQAFGYAVDAAALFDTDADERVLLQGVIDACFIENGAWVLVDYKTDRAIKGETDVLAAKKHAPQLDRYAVALAALTGIPVRERWVVLLSRRSSVLL